MKYTYKYSGFVLFALLVAVNIFGFTHPAFAQQTLGAMTDNLYFSLLSLQTFLSMLSYLLGTFFTIVALRGIKNYVDDPDRNTAQYFILRLIAGAFFIFAPTFANIIVDSIGGGSVGEGDLLTYTNQTTPDINQDGLEGALVNFVYDFAEPFLSNLLPFFSYAAGIILMMIGLKRLAQDNGNGPQAAGGTGTMGTFLVAAMLLALGYIMYAFNMSLFGTDTVTSNPLLVTTASPALQESAQQVMWGVFIFLRIVGYISVVRGLFMLRGAAEGQNVSMMAVSTHLIAGAMLANATAFVLAVQETFVNDPANYILTP